MSAGSSTGNEGSAGAAAAGPKIDIRKRSVMLRIAGVALIFGLAGWYLYANVFNLVSVSGVVSAPVLRISSPIDGEIVASMISDGENVKKGQALMTIRNDRLDKRPLANLEVQESSAKSGIASLNSEIAELEKIHTDLIERKAGHTSWNAARLEQSLQEAQAEAETARVDHEQKQADLSRMEVLASKNVDSRKQLDDARFSLRRTEAEMSRTSARANTFKQQLDAAKQGILLGDGYSGATYSEQRADEIKIQLIRLGQEKARLESSLSSLDKQLEAERDYYLQNSTRDLASPADGIIAVVLAGQGVEVAKSTPLVDIIDTSRSFVEAAAPQKGFRSIGVGDKVKVWLVGSPEALTGVVRSIQGAGVARTDGRSAALPPKIGPDGVLVIVELNPAELSKYFGSTSQVGRKARVRF